MAGITRMSARIDRRRFLVASSGAIVGAAAIGRSATAFAQDGSGITATLVTDTAGIGDQNFNDLANAGGNRAAEELGVTWEVLESQTQADYVANLVLALEQSDVAVPNGFLLEDAVNEVAPQFPDKAIVFIDAVSEAGNVQSALFNENEGAFLAGALAGLATTTGTVGFIGGIRVPPVMRYEVGFGAGLQSTNPAATYLISYADDFEDPAFGKELSLAQYNNGADILMQAAGRTGIGCFDAAKEKGLGFWVVAGDTDQSQLGAEHQIAYVKKGVDEAVFQGIEQVVNGAFEPGIRTLGLVDGGMDLLGFHSSLGQDIIDTIAAYKQAIIDGSLVVPTDDETYAAFTPVPPDQVGGTADPIATPAASPVATPAT